MDDSEKVEEGEQEREGVRDGDERERGEGERERAIYIASR